MRSIVLTIPDRTDNLLITKTPSINSGAIHSNTLAMHFYDAVTGCKLVWAPFRRLLLSLGAAADLGIISQYDDTKELNAMK